MGGARRSALIVANDTYHDQRLRRLRAPAADAQELARVLRDVEVGGFDVEVCLNEPEHVLRRRLSAFFDGRGVDDLLLLHLSCHGVKDEDGRLYFATPDTEIDHLDATSVPAEYVNRQMTRSRSRRIVLLLDCCYSGAFARGMLNRADERIDLVERFDGRGRIVLTASSAMEYSFEGDQPATGDGRPSVFTSALVEGLSTGEADRNRDGFVSVDELYDFAFDRVRTVTPAQTPGKWVFDVQGDFYLARSNRKPVEEAGLPGDLRTAVASPFTQVRLGAVEELAAMLGGPDPVRSAAARDALAELATRDGAHVVRSAARAAGAPSTPTTDEPVELTPALPVRRAAPEAQVEPPPPAWGARTLRLAAVALLVALPMPLLAQEDLDEWNIFAALSPVEAAGAAAAVWVAAGRLRDRAWSTTTAAGVLTAVGILIGVGGVALLKFSAQRIGTVGVALGLVVLAGALAALVTAAACLRAAPQEAEAARIEPAWVVLALVGASLAGLALVIPYDGFSSLWSEVLEAESAEFFFAPAAGVVCLVTGITLLSSRPRFAAPFLMASGGLTSLHFVGLLVAAWGGIGEVGAVRAAGLVGVVGGALVLFAARQARTAVTRPA